MIELLKAVRKVLQDNLSGTRRDDIYIAPDLAFFPQGTKFPCVPLKDARSKHDYGASESKDKKMRVRMAFWQKLSAKEAALVGSEGGTVGVLDLAQDAIEILENNRLEIPDFSSGRVVDDPGSVSYTTKTDKTMYQRKELEFEWEKDDC